MNTYTVQRDDTALLIVDIQDRMMPSMANGFRVIKNTGVLLQAAKVFHLPVLYTEQYPRGLGDTSQDLKAVLEEIEAVRAEKTAFNADTPEIQEALSKGIAKDCKKIIVTGVETHICVFQTVRTLLEKGYEVFVPADAVSSRTPENRKVALRLLAQMGAVVTSTESLLFDFLGDSKDPKFKELQALIK